MTRSEARDAAERYVAAMDGAADLAINDDLTEKHPAGFVFFYNSRTYWRTRDLLDGVAGNGPLLVRADGAVVALPANRPIAESLAAF